MLWNHNLRLRARNGFATAAAITLRARVTPLVLAGAVALLGLFGGAAAEAKSVAVIRNDPGGNLENRLAMLGQYRASGTRVEIRGRCDSACTMFLGLPNTCVARSSRFGFHGPQSQYYGISLPPDEFEYWSMVMADHYPSSIRSWFLNEARQTTMGVITISGSQAIRMGARACE